MHAGGKRVLAAWPFVGRQEELEHLRRAIRADTGATIRGAPGVGKTRLLDEALGSARGPVHRIAGIAGLRDTPLGALAPLIGPAVGEAASSTLEELLQASHGSPPILAVDDAHLLDPFSAGLVQLAAISGWATVLLTVRSEEPAPASLERLWATGPVELIDLGELADDDLISLMNAALGGMVERGTAEVLLRSAAGNVLYLRELLAGSIAGGAIAHDDGVWHLRGRLIETPTLQDLITARLGSLDHTAREAVELLAVSGSLPSDLAADLIDPEVMARLERDALVGSRITAGSVTVDLAHPLYGEVVRNGLSALARLRISRRLVRTAVHAPSMPPGFDLRIARWVVDAGPDDPDLTTEDLERLARRAVEVGDTHLAAVLAEAAFDRGAPPSVAAFASWCRGEDGEHDRCEALLARAYERAADGETEPFELASVIVEWASLRWWVTQDLGSALKLLDRARACGGDGAALADAQHAMFETLDGHSARAITRARPLTEHPNDAVAAVAAGAMGPSLSATDQPVQARQIAAAGFERCQVAMLNLPGIAGVHVVSMVFAELVDGDIAAATAFSELLTYGAVRQPARQARAWSTLMSSMVGLLAGRLTASFEAARQSDVLWRDTNIPAMARWAGIQAALAALERGDLLTARAQMERHRGICPDGFRLLEPRWHQAAALLAWREGDLDRALAAVDTGAEVARAGGATHAELECLHLLARWGLRSQSAAASDHVGSLTLGSRLSRVRADHLAAVAADDAEALADVAARFGDLGLPILAAEAWTQASESFRVTGRSRQHLNAATRATELLDALDPLDRPPEARGRRAEPPVRISRREREVARLAADGHTNREIAEQLCLSERTVENHLYRVFAKLGIRSRRELSGALDARRHRN